MEVKLNRFYKVIMVFSTVFTLGIGGIIMWLQTRSWPKLIDEQGITTRGGKRFMWDQVKNIYPVIVRNHRGNRIGGRVEIEFEKKKIRVVPQSLENGWGVVDYISQITGVDVKGQL